jgi:hypothetical protein
VATYKTIDGKRGTRYRAIIRKRGQQLSRTFPTKTDAKRWAEKTEDEIERGNAGLIQEGHTLAEAVDRPSCPRHCSC